MIYNMFTIAIAGLNTLIIVEYLVAQVNVCPGLC